MKKPIVSIVGPAIKTQFWLDFYNMIADTNKTSFEIIFAGHVAPDFDLPPNFIWLETKHYDNGDGLKPAACVELAIRKALRPGHVRGKYIMWVADDCYIPPGVIDKQLAELKDKKNKGKRLMVGTGFAGSQKIGTEPGNSLRLVFHNSHKGSPVMPIFPMMLKKHIKDIGSLDERFEAIYWDLDMTMRHYSLGGELIQLDVNIYEYGGHGLWHKFKGDRKFLDSLWEGKQNVEKRSSSVVPYDKNYFDNKHIIEHKG